MSLFFSVNRRQSFKVRGLLACGMLAIGAVLAAPLGARALDFDWYFTDFDTGVITRGTLKGLVEGYNPGGAGEVVEVVDTPATLALGGYYIFDKSLSSPFAFNVVNGEMVAADAFYQREEGGPGTTPNGGRPNVGFGKFGPGVTGIVWNAQIYDGESKSLRGFPTVFAVPAPLPIFGVAAALGYGRQLRSRVRSARRRAEVAPTV